MPNQERGLMGNLQDAWRWIAGAGPGGLEGHLAPLAPLAQQPFTLEELAAVIGPLDYEITAALQPQGEGLYSLARAFSQGTPEMAWLPPLGIDWSQYEMAHNHPGLGLAHGISPGDVRSFAGRGVPAAHVMANGRYMSLDRDSIDQMLELMKEGRKLRTAGKGEILGQ